MNERGRSMVEMLGVLAIIGVLSVGAIAGYSKAMEKYKLNKNIEQISAVIDFVYLHLHDFHFPDNQEKISLIKYMQALNAVPEGLTYGQNNNNDYLMTSNGIYISYYSQKNTILKIMGDAKMISPIKFAGLSDGIILCENILAKAQYYCRRQNGRGQFLLGYQAHAGTNLTATYGYKKFLQMQPSELRDICQEHITRGAFKGLSFSFIINPNYKYYY